MTSEVHILTTDTTLQKNMCHGRPLREAANQRARPRRSSFPIFHSRDARGLQNWSQRPCTCSYHLCCPFPHTGAHQIRAQPSCPRRDHRRGGRAAEGRRGAAVVHWPSSEQNGTNENEAEALHDAARFAPWGGRDYGGQEPAKAPPLHRPVTRSPVGGAGGRPRA